METLEPTMVLLQVLAPPVLVWVAWVSTKSFSFAFWPAFCSCKEDQRELPSNSTTMLPPTTIAKSHKKNQKIPSAWNPRNQTYLSPKKHSYWKERAATNPETILRISSCPVLQKRSQRNHKQ